MTFCSWEKFGYFDKYEYSHADIQLLKLSGLFGPGFTPRDINLVVAERSKKTTARMNDKSSKFDRGSDGELVTSRRHPPGAQSL